MDEKEKIDIAQGERISRIEASVESLIADIGRISNNINKLGEYVNKSGKTEWGTLASWSGLIITLGILAATPVVTTMNTITKNLDKLTERVNDHTDDGHPESVLNLLTKLDEKLDAFEKRGVKTDDELSTRVQSLEYGDASATADRFTRSDAELLFNSMHDQIKAYHDKN